jgi:hypothetical protein
MVAMSSRVFVSVSIMKSLDVDEKNKQKKTKRELTAADQQRERNVERDESTREEAYNRD